MARLTTIIQGSKPKTVSSNPLSYSGRQPKAGGIQSCKRRGDGPSGCQGSHTNPGADMNSRKPSHTRHSQTAPHPLSRISMQPASALSPGFLHESALQTHLLSILMAPTWSSPWSLVPHLDCCKASQDHPLQGAIFNLSPANFLNMSARMIFIKHTSDLVTPLRVTYQAPYASGERPNLLNN